MTIAARLAKLEAMAAQKNAVNPYDGMRWRLQTEYDQARCLASIEAPPGAARDEQLQRVEDAYRALEKYDNDH